MKIIYKGFVSKKYEKMVQFFSQGNFKQAKDACLKILDTDENDPLALKAAAFCLMLEDGADREAHSYLEDAQRVAMMDSEIPNLLALIALRSNNMTEAIEILLNAMDRLGENSLLTETLEQIKEISNPDFAKFVSIPPMMHLTLPSRSLDFKALYKKYYRQIFIFYVILFMGICFIAYPYLRNVVVSNISSPTISPATMVTIKDIKELINARENFRIVLEEKVIERKFNELREAISSHQRNRATIIANELLASNASIAVKERVRILQGFIAKPTTDNIDYVPSYAQLAVAPSIYEGVYVRWQGTIANTSHQGRRQTTFDLLINFTGYEQVEGIALVEVEGFHEYINGNKVTVIGSFEGFTQDNRAIIKGMKILPL